MIAQQFQIRVLASTCAVLAIVAVIGWGLAITRGAALEAAGANKAVAENNAATAKQAASDCGVYTERIAAIQNECAAEGERLREENERAVEEAFAAGKAEALAGNEYNRLINNREQLPPDCTAVLDMELCPEVMDY